MTASKVLERKDVPQESRWNSEAVFSSWDEWRVEREGVDMICEGMVPLGEEYVEVLRRGCLEDGWNTWPPLHKLTHKTPHGGLLIGGPK